MKKVLGIGILGLGVLAAQACAVEGTDGESVDTASQAYDSCAGLPTWQGNNYQFTPSAGTEIQLNGTKYKANVNISYPNAECAPNNPAGWCSGWFSNMGACEVAGGGSSGGGSSDPCDGVNPGGNTCGHDNGNSMQFANLWVAMANHMGRINPTKDLKKVNNNTRLALSTEGQARCQANGGCDEVLAVLEMQNTAVNEFLCQEIFDANVFAHNLIAMWDVQKNREIAAAGAGTLPPAHKVELVGTSQAACGLDWTYKVSKETCSGGGGGTAAFLESGGQVAMEAEHFDSKRGAGSANFNQSGGAMVCGPDTGAFWTNGWGGNSPKLSFNVNFSSTGTYTVWVKAKAAHGGNDSFHAGLDGAENTSADKMTVGSQFGSFVWSKATMDGPAATLNVNSAGVHAVDIYAREDGIEVDKIVLTKNGSTPSGNGPAESPRSSGGGGGGDCSLPGSVVDFYSGFYRDYNPVLDIDVNGDTITGDPSGTTNDDPGSGSGSCTNACSKYNPNGSLIGSCCNCNGQEGHFIQTSMMGGKILACNF